MLKPKLNCAVRRWIASPLNYPPCNHLQDSLSCPEKGRVSRSFFKRFRANTRFKILFQRFFITFGAFFTFRFIFLQNSIVLRFSGVVCFIPSCFPVLPEPVSYIVPRRCETLRGAAPKPRRHFENVGQTTTAQTAQARFTCYSPQVSSHPAGTIRPGIARACRARRRARTKDVARIAWT